MRAVIKRFRTDVAGATAIEYGLIAALIATVIVGSLTLLSNTTNNKYNAVSGAVSRSM